MLKKAEPGRNRGQASGIQTIYRPTRGMHVTPTGMGFRSLRNEI